MATGTCSLNYRSEAEHCNRIAGARAEKLVLECQIARATARLNYVKGQIPST